LKYYIESILDFTYPFFRRFFDKTTFRYAACGGVNTLFDIFLFFINYNIVFKKENLDLSFIVISPHIASFLFAFLISFPTGFFLMRYVVFQESTLKGRIQFFRYFVTVMVAVLLNYVFLKVLVEKIGLFPTVAKVITTFFVVAFSYISQRNFSFSNSQTTTQQ
jgi:putative flippase GtrA